jgi:hypothetical protein
MFNWKKQNHAKMKDAGPRHLAVEAPGNRLWTVKSIREQARIPVQEFFQ